MCGMVVESTTNGHVQPSRIQSQRYPSQSPQRIARTSTSIPTRSAALLMAAARRCPAGCSAAIVAIAYLLPHSREPFTIAQMLDPGRTVEELRELQELTGDENGAQRVAWTEIWERAREWLRSKVAETGAEETIDAAGNQWFTLRGGSERAVLIGGHIDSVPNGGWLDGALNVVAGLEVVRRLAEEGSPPVTVRLVNWADEEGSRFGRSLFGSSAAAGSMADQDELRARRDADGVALPDALSEHGVDLDRAIDARSELEGAAAYLELHIEQGPVLESMDIPLGVVLGTFGVERHQVTFRGQAAHAGSTPMDKRRDALAGAA